MAIATGPRQWPHRMSLTVLQRRDWFATDGFPIAVERRNPQQPFGLHAHDFAEIVIITSGRGIHKAGRETHPLNTGDVFVIGGSRPHDYPSMDQLCLVNILYQPEKLELENQDLPSLPGYHALFILEPAWRRRHKFNSRLRLNPAELARLLGLVDQLETELTQRSQGFRFLATACFMQIIGYLARCFAHAPNPDSRALLRIGEAISHLEAHYQAPTNLNQLAALAHMSKRNFMRNFKAAMGNSPIAYLMQLRVNRAAALLRRPHKSVTEVAFEVGFEDSNYFSRQFKNIIGVTPMQYRKQHASLD